MFRGAEAPLFHVDAGIGEFCSADTDCHPRLAMLPDVRAILQTCQGRVTTSLGDEGKMNLMLCFALASCVTGRLSAAREIFLFQAPSV